MDVIKDITFSSIQENLLGDFDLDLFIPENIDGDIVRKHVKLKDGKPTNNNRKNSTNVPHEMTYNNRNVDKKSKEMYSRIKSGSGKIVTSDSDISESHKSSEDTPRNEYQILERSPRQPKWTRVPLVVFVHGGGWRRGGKMAWKHYLYHDVNFMVAILQWLLNVHHNVGESLAQNGVGCALISYPLTEQGFPIVLVEMVLSYIQSCLVTCLGLLPFGILLCLYQTHGTYHSTGARITIILSVLLVTNIITLVIFTLKRIKFKLSLLHVAILWIFTVSTCTLIHLLFQQYQLSLWTSVTLILYQLVILRQRLSRCDIGYSDQAKVVARAVHWAKRLAIKTGQFDKEKIFLMGHSAGGHLSSLTVLDEFYLRDVRSAVPNIKGVISLSGVYDLGCLNSKLIKHIYLLPNFGGYKTTWRKASPIHQVKKSKSAWKPKFLLMSAQVDPFLEQQSQDFSEKLKTFGIECDHVTVHGSNHFTIITNIERTFDDSDRSVLKLILNFISQN